MPNRELANIFFPFDISILSNPMTNNNIIMNIDMDNPRGKIVNASANSSRKSSTHSSVSSIERMEAQNNNSSWADQVNEFNKLQGFSLSYASPKIGDDNTNNKATRPANMLNPHEEDIININMNMCFSQELDSSSIPYEKNYHMSFKFIYAEDTFLQWCCHYNIYNTSLPSMMAIFLQHILIAMMQ